MLLNNRVDELSFKSSKGKKSPVDMKVLWGHPQNQNCLVC